MESDERRSPLRGPYEQDRVAGRVEYHVTHDAGDPGSGPARPDTRQYVFACQHLASYERQVKMALSHEFRMNADGWGRMMHLSCQVYRVFRRTDGEPLLVEAGRVGREWLDHGFTTREVEVAIVRSLEVLGREIGPAEQDIVHAQLVARQG